MEQNDNIITNEIWKEINGYENFMVSSLGRIKNCLNNKILKITINRHNNNYCVVNLTKNNVQKLFYVNRLVANTFIENTNNKPQIDHINNNKLDNTIFNLRYCSIQENSQNKPKMNRLTTSKFKGVRFIKRNKKWNARITHNNKIINLGTFETEQEAGKAYDKKATELFGNYAKLNFN